MHIPLLDKLQKFSIVLYLQLSAMDAHIDLLENLNTEK